MSNSPLVEYIHLSPNCNTRTQKITKITPHHMAGNLTIETCGNVFAPSSRQASSNYGIGTDGRIGMYVEECNRAWTSSSAWNDQQAVTIEVANCSTGGEWPVSDAAWESLVDLCVDICQRNDIPELVWTGDSSGSLTTHDMFASTNCPGPYLKSRMALLASEVNARLNGETTEPSKPQTSVTDVPAKSVDELAREVIEGKYGNGDARVRALGSRYDEVQARVNEILGGGSSASKPTLKPAVDIDDLARRTINGEFGNGDARKKALGSNYAAVQARVNEILGGGSVKPSGKSIETLAQEVIRGEWGNGEDRKKRLQAAGYNYQAVQNRVNQLLG